jgi:hypothetical protein
VEHRDDADVPLVIRMNVAVSRFAQRDGKVLRISPPLAPDLGRMATLPARQTPLLIGESLHRRIDVAIELPPTARPDPAAAVTVENDGRRVVISDGTDGHVFRIQRSIDIPAGRIQPDDYPRFARFAHDADGALSRPITARLP